MRTNRRDLEYFAKYIEDLYLVTKKVVTSENDEKEFEWIEKDSIAVLCRGRSSCDYMEFCCYGRKRASDWNDGSLPIFNLIDLVKSGEVRPLTKEEKYEILSRYAKKMSSKMDKIKTQARKMLDIT